MLSTTIEATTAILRADPTVTPAERSRLVALFRQPSESVDGTANDLRIIRRGEVARRLGVSTRTVDKLALQHILTKVRFPSRGRAAGFREADVIALICEQGVA